MAWSAQCYIRCSTLIETLQRILVYRLINLEVVGTTAAVSRCEGRISSIARSFSTTSNAVRARESYVVVDLLYIFELGRLSCPRITRMMPLTLLCVSTLHCDEDSGSDSKPSSAMWVETEAALGQRLPTLRDGVSSPDFCLFG
jgi:hypothetical protein